MTGAVGEPLARGSSSFSTAAKLLPPGIRDSVARLYAWCRHCDDVIDGQVLGAPGGVAPRDAGRILEGLRAGTRAVFRGKAPADPAFHALATVVERHNLPEALPLAHLDGFAMDVDGRCYARLDDLLDYCYGVAGVVGVMMAHVLGVRDGDTLDRAADLGLAFQLTNIARDVVDDAGQGRIYLPLSWLQEEGLDPHRLAEPACRPAVAAVAARLVSAAEPYYRSGLVGIGRLPPRAGIAIGAARSVYRAIGHKVVESGPAAYDRRIRTNGSEKVALVASGVVSALAARRRIREPRDPLLWSRPR